MEYRKGNTAISITVLVVFIIIMSAAVLFMFYTSSNDTKLFIGDVRFVEKSILEKEKATFIVDKMAETAFTDTYREIGMNATNQETFRALFEKKLTEQILNEKLGFEKEEDLKRSVREGKSMTSMQGESVIFDSGEIVFTSFLAIKNKENVLVGETLEESADLAVFYRTRITVNVSAKDL